LVGRANPPRIVLCAFVRSSGTTRTPGRLERRVGVPAGQIGYIPWELKLTEARLRTSPAHPCARPAPPANPQSPHGGECQRCKRMHDPVDGPGGAGILFLRPFLLPPGKIQ